VSEKKGGEQRCRGAEEEEKRELVIFGYKAQEIPPKISFTPSQEGNRSLSIPQVES